MARVRQRWWILGGTLATLLVTWLVLRPRGAIVDVARASRAPLEVLVEEAGETRAVNQTTLTAPVTGVMQPTVRDAGARVEAGAVVATFEPLALDPRARSEAEARRTRADALRTAAAARLRAADSTVRDAARLHDRVRALAQVGAVSVREVEQASLQRLVAEQAQQLATAALREAEAEWETARAALATGGTAVALRAPVAGRILTVHERDRRVVPAGAPVLTLGDVGALEIWFDVLSRDALRIRPGQALRLDLGAGLESEAGEVVRVEPGAFAKRSPLGVEERRVRIVGRPLRALDDVGDGYRAQIAVIVWSRADVLQVPASAFTRDASGWAVYVVEEGTVRRRAVTPGERGASAWEVREGIAEGTPVVRYPDVDLRDGARVRMSGTR